MTPSQTPAGSGADAAAVSKLRLAPLDGIRAVAILLVVVFHLASGTKLPLDVLGPGVIPVLHGMLGVDLFFGLSGFLITRLWMEEERAAPGDAPRARITRFYARRALRILPPFYFILALDLLVLPWLCDIRTLSPFAGVAAADPTAALPYAALVANYGNLTSPSPGTAFSIVWSLCVEEHFYLFWPWVLLLVRKPRSRVAVALATCGAMLALRWLALKFGDHRHGLTSFSMVRYASHFRMDSILWGAAAALAYDAIAAAPRVRRVCLAALLVAVALFTMRGELSPLKRPMLWGASVGFSVVAAAAALLAAEVTAAPRSWLARALALRPLATLGFYSYGIYLVHPLMTDAAWWLAKRAIPEQNLAQFTLTFALAVAMALAGSWAMYQTVERPFRRLRAKMRAPGGARHDEPAIAAEPAGPGAVAAG